MVIFNIDKTGVAIYKPEIYRGLGEQLMASLG